MTSGISPLDIVKFTFCLYASPSSTLNSYFTLIFSFSSTYFKNALSSNVSPSGKLLPATPCLPNVNETSSSYGVNGSQFSLSYVISESLSLLLQAAKLRTTTNANKKIAHLDFIKYPPRNFPNYIRLYHYLLIN